MAKFNLELGLEITKIKEFIEFLLKTYVVMDCTIGMQLHSHGLIKNLRHDRLRSKDAIAV